MKSIHIQKSSIAGLGLFLHSSVKQGETVITLSGPLKRLPYKPEYALMYPNWLGVGIEQWIDPDPGLIWRFLNHSCNPNAGFSGNTTIIALNPIQHGEEMTIDYSMTEADPYWFMECKCGTASCRNVIKGWQFLPAETCRKYQGFIPSWMYQFSQSYFREG